SMAGQLKVQAIGVIATLVFTAVATWIILKLLDALIGLRVSDEEETQGLDLSQHEERGYDL
ncbi:MAG: ammonium transporter, partial [Gammaproteobacteria bacterium]